MLFCVNGTLMRGLSLNRNLLDTGARFVEEAHTAPIYRLWSIGDRYPGMLRSAEAGCEIAVELWEADAAGLVHVLEGEPPGLTIGRVRLADGRDVLGVLAEPYLVKGQPEITATGGWRAYIDSLNPNHADPS
jgi:gamma-glutamylcyclotransferase (GGCT)/AIG2-like uncharacterized protein YtfP